MPKGRLNKWSNIQIWKLIVINSRNGFRIIMKRKEPLINTRPLNMICIRPREKKASWEKVRCNCRKTTMPLNVIRAIKINSNKQLKDNNKWSRINLKKQDHSIKRNWVNQSLYNNSMRVSFWNRWIVAYKTWKDLNLIWKIVNLLMILRMLIKKLRLRLNKHRLKNIKMLKNWKWKPGLLISIRRENKMMM